MKVVGVSGAQGAGKSTMLSMMNGFGYRVDDFKVSRAVQKALGWETLENVMNDWDTMVAFQEVLKQKSNHDSMLHAKMPHELGPSPNARITLAGSPDSSEYIVLTERTFADIAAYANLWVWKHFDRRSVTLDEALEWIVPYVSRCATLQRSLYEATILLPFMPNVVSWEEDKNRASRSDVDLVFEDIERFLERAVGLDHKTYTIKTGPVIDRAQELNNFLRSL